ALGRNLLRVQPGPASGPGIRAADGRMVPQEDQRGRRLQGLQVQDRRRTREQGHHPGGRHGGPDPGLRHLRGARARRHRRGRVGGAARRSEARAPQHGALLLFPGMARARNRQRVQLQQEGVRGAAGRSAPHAGPRGRSSAVMGAAAVAVVSAPDVIAQPKIQWRMSTTWTAALDLLQGAAQRLGKVVDEMSGGRFRIDVVPGGQVIGLLECFDAASKGTIEAFMGSPQYWSNREPAIEWFGSIPFGMNPAGMAAWYYQGDGLKLMEEAYAPFNLVPRPAMADAPQMAGWFRR